MGNGQEAGTARDQSLSTRLTRLQRLSVPTPPNFTVLERTLSRVIERYDAPSSTSLHNATAYLEKFLEKVQARDWKRTPLSFVTQVAGFAFASEFRNEARFQLVRDFLIAEVHASTRTAFLNSMVRVYMESFVPAGEHTDALAAALGERHAYVGLRWQRLLAAADLFQPAAIVTQLAELMTNMDDPWRGLRALGLRQPHASGLMDYVHLEFLEQSKGSLTTPTAINRMLSWLKPDGQVLRRVGAGAAISALLWPWKDNQPDASISSTLIDRLTEFYGHPKASRDPAWNEVDPELERIFMRWLMKADFKFLFRILNEVEKGHMWPDREAYWLTMLERGIVDELWVAFNEAGYSSAMKRMPAEMRRHARFGLQVGEQDKSILIMRIGRFIVVEGTYSFPVLIFDAASADAPKLFQTRYDVARMRDKRHVDRVPHHSGWQTKVSRSLGSAR